MALEKIVEICVAIDIAILGIAYPIIVDKITNIGEKYSSEYISVLFDNEFPQKSLKVNFRNKEYKISFFKLALYITVFTFIFLIVDVHPLWGLDNWFINDSANIIVFICTLILTVLFFMWLDKVFLYNGKSTSFLKKLVTDYNRLPDSELKNYYLRSINELTIYAIEKQDEHLQETLLEFYYREFAYFRKQHDRTKPIEYPVDLYFLINKLTYQLVNNENKKLLAIEHRAISGTWLLGDDFEDIQISEKTYEWLWRNLFIICDKERYIKMYWANVSQYFNYRLEFIDKIYDRETVAVLNMPQYNQRVEERRDFLELHYALGGLLLYREQYKSLSYIFEFTQSQPPSYPMLPHSMTEIFEWFEYFRNEFKFRGSDVSSKYYFPELDNLGNRRHVNFWICSYLTLLFIRQYTLRVSYVYQNHTALPILPGELTELYNWLDTASYFEAVLNETLKNTNLINVFQWTDLISDNKDKFDTFIIELKAAISNKTELQKEEAQPSPAKISLFLDSSNKIITNALNEYETILAPFNESLSDSDVKIAINGSSTLISKSAFTEDDIPNINYDTFFASQIARSRISKIIPNSFLMSSTKRYLLNKENIVAGIEKIIGEDHQAIIIAFNLSYELSELIQTSKYTAQVQHLPNAEFRDVLFILNKTNLPTIEFKDLKEKEKEEFSLSKINERLNVYASVIDINAEENSLTRAKWNLDIEPTKDLKVQITISFLWIIHWKKSREIVQLNYASKFKEQGIQDDINDINPLK